MATLPLEISSNVEAELRAGLDLLRRVEAPLVSFFGSARTSEDDHYFQLARQIAQKLAERHVGVLTGGGPGIMRAVNFGATERDGISVGLKAKLLISEAVNEPIYTHQLALEYMFVRRYLLAARSSALLFFPGGFGTLDELTDYLVHHQIGLKDPVPIICIGSSYWNGLLGWMHEQMSATNSFINHHELKLVTVVDTLEEVLDLLA